MQFDSYSHKKNKKNPNVISQHGVVFMFCLFPPLFDYIKEIRQVFRLFFSPPIALSIVCAQCHIIKRSAIRPLLPPPSSSLLSFSLRPPSPLVTANFQFCCNALDSGMFRSPSAHSCAVSGSTEAQFCSSGTERNSVFFDAHSRGKEGWANGRDTDGRTPDSADPPQPLPPPAS